MNDNIESYAEIADGLSFSDMGEYHDPVLRLERTDVAQQHFNQVVSLAVSQVVEAPQIYKSLANNEYGHTLNNEVRFGRFKPDFITNAQWVEMLGQDVNNLEHMEFTAGLTAWYIYRAKELGDPFTKEQENTLMTTAWTHDFAEAIDGDVADPDKDHSSESKRLERLSFFTVAKSVDAGHLTNLVMDVTQGKHELSRHFRAIEVIGYATTGERAGEVMVDIENWKDWYGLTDDQANALFNNLEWLNNEVVSSAIENLHDNYRDLPVVEDFLNYGIRA
jgi:hypothetical protein